MSVNIRRAQPDDADFIAWLILTAGRAHVKRGIWEVILGLPEQQCLDFLKHLSITKNPHLFHHSIYLVAEVDGSQVAGLGGYDPAVCGHPALMAAIPEVLMTSGISGLETVSPEHTPRITACIPEPLDDTWVVDSVAVLPAFRRRGIVGRLLAEVMAAGGEKGFSRAQINIYIGNDPARRLYEKHGFKIVDEIRDPYFQQQIGSPGMARMVRELTE